MHCRGAEGELFGLRSQIQSLEQHLIGQQDRIGTLEEECRVLSADAQSMMLEKALLTVRGELVHRENEVAGLKERLR